MAQRLLTPRWWTMRHHPVQQALWRCLVSRQKRVVYVSAARQSGKSEIARRFLVLALAEVKPWDDPRYFYAAPTRDQAYRLAWEHMLKLIPEAWIGDPDKDISHTHLTIKTLFGSTLYVIGLDKPHRAEGDGFDGGILDETSDVKPKAFRKSIGPALTRPGWWLLKIGVPKTDGVGAPEFRRDCERAARGDDPDEAHYTWPSADIMEPDQLDYWRRQMPPAEFAEQFEGKWQTAGGQVFYAFDRTIHVAECHFDPNMPVVVGCDFNVDPMAWELGHVYDGPPRTIRWFDELWLSNCNTPKALDTLWHKYGQHSQSQFHFFGEAAARQRRTSAYLSDYKHIHDDPRFKGKGSTVNFPRAAPAVADRIASMNAMLCNAAREYRQFMSERCAHLIVDMEMRAYRENTRELSDSGRSGTTIGHPSDAASYAVHALFPVGSERKGGRAEVRIQRPTSTPRPTGGPPRMRR